MTLHLILAFLLSSEVAFGVTPDERTFEATFNDLVQSFERDVTSRDLPIRSEVAFRLIEVQGDIPSSFRQHLKSRLSEALLRSKVGIVRTPGKLVRALDVQLYLDRQKLVLGISIHDLETNTLLKQLNYDSDELKAGSAQFSYMGKNETSVTDRVMQYPPSLLYGVSFSMVSLPDFGVRYSAGELGIRVLERYSSRKFELGTQLSVILGGGVAGGSAYEKISFQNVLTLGRSFFGHFENYDQLRILGFLGLGGYYADGIIGSVLRGGIETRIGKSFSVVSSVGFRPKATGLLSSETRSLSGIEVGIGLIAQFESYGRNL